MTKECRCDFETRSDVDLKTRGAAPYFASPHWRALGLTYRFEGDDLRDWEMGQPCPDDLRWHIEQGGMIRAFNASFERQCFEQLHLREGWPAVTFEQFRCTAAEAAAMSLPRSLDGVGAALGAEVRKDKEGMRLIRKFSIPRKPRAGETKTVECDVCNGLGAVDGEMDYHGPCGCCKGSGSMEVPYGPDDVLWNEPADYPEDYAKFVRYRRLDVLAEEAVAKRIIPLSDAEQALYVLNEKINARGIRIDRQSAISALRLAEKAKAALDKEMREVTGGYVGACTQVTALVEWVQQQGVELNSAAKAEITDLLEADDVPAHVRKALELRQEAAKTSVSKLSAMLKRANDDGRVRGTSMYHAAGTGRFQSAGVNFNNMPRPRRIFDDEKPRRDVLFKAFRTEEPAALKMIYGDELGRPLHLVSDAIRGFIWAAPGKELLQADYSGIEGAVIAWLADEVWKLKALYELIENPELPDMYRRTAASILGLTIEEVTKKHWARQAVGKVSELALGFGGGVPAFYSMSKNYNVNLDPIFEPVWKSSGEDVREKAVKRYENQLKRGLSQTNTLSRNAWIACEIIKLGWRAANPAIAQSWRDLEKAMREAVRNPGQVFSAAKVDYIVKRGFLWARLPSNRCLAYGAPRLKDQVRARVKCKDGTWSDPETMDRDVAEKAELKGLAKIEGDTSARVTALAVNSTTKQWERFALYGGLAAENNTQGTARDLLVNGMWKAEGAGYPIIATVYDEMITEVPTGFGDLAAFEKLICELPPWAAGMPLTAGGWRGKRYRKE